VPDAFSSGKREIEVRPRVGVGMPLFTKLLRGGLLGNVACYAQLRTLLL
jgi:hypothetical protein